MLPRATTQICLQLLCQLTLCWSAGYYQQQLMRLSSRSISLTKGLRDRIPPKGAARPTSLAAAVQFLSQERNGARLHPVSRIRHTCNPQHRRWLPVLRMAPESFKLAKRTPPRAAMSWLAFPGSDIVIRWVSRTLIAVSFQSTEVCTSFRTTLRMYHSCRAVE